MGGASLLDQDLAAKAPASILLTSIKWMQIPPSPYGTYRAKRSTPKIIQRLTSVSPWPRPGP